MHSRVFSTLFMAVFVSFALQASAAVSTCKDLFKTSPPSSVCAGSACLRNGSIVEGSIEHGGAQPHYKVDAASPEIQSFLTGARSVARSGKTFWDKIFLVSRYSRQATIRWRYDDPIYLELMREFRERGEPIPLSRYLNASCGVCREQAMLLHLALKEVGFDTTYLYVNIYKDDRYMEDHALVTVQFQGETWLVDSRNSAYSGRRLVDTMKPGGIHPSDRKIPMPLPEFTFDPYGERFVLSNYPRIYNPENTDARGEQ